jgi:hypothetical protein
VNGGRARYQDEDDEEVARGRNDLDEDEEDMDRAYDDIEEEQLGADLAAHVGLQRAGAGASPSILHLSSMHPP